MQKPFLCTLLDINTVFEKMNYVASPYLPYITLSSYIVKELVNVVTNVLKFKYGQFKFFMSFIIFITIWQVVQDHPGLHLQTQRQLLPPSRQATQLT